MDVGLVFGIIFAAIVIILLVFFGFKYINEVMVLSCESQAGQQVKNLESVVKSTFALSKGGSQELRIIVPNCIERFCFADPDHPEIENVGGGWNPNEFVTNLVSRYRYNVILMKSNNAVDGYRIENFKPYVNFCLESSRNVIVRNQGAFVDVTLPEF